VLKEFAVDPGVISSNYHVFRYLFEKFGAETGRLISRFPKNWKKLAIEAAERLPDGFSKERMIQRLGDIDKEGWLKLIASNRPYAAPGSSWLENAVIAHANQPFHAIICDRDDPGTHLVNGELCDADNPLLAVDTVHPVSRKANDLAWAAVLLLRNCRQLRLVDPYFDPGRPKWRDSLGAFLSFIPDITKVECEYHLLKQDKWPEAEFIRRLQFLGDVIPAGGRLRVVRWRVKDDGERFHRRYLLTNNAGLNYEGGLDPDVGEGQTTDVTLLDRNLHQQRWSEYNLDSPVFELFKPVLVVDSAGQVTEEG
jgi:hypothetical protein